MDGFFVFEAIKSWLRNRRRKELLQLAQNWPLALGEVLNWTRMPAVEETGSLATPFQIEARYYFTLNGEYYGGHFRSVGMGAAEAGTIPAATPKVQVRYDPANPDRAVVRAEDNVGNLPFRVMSGY
jgi:hypothetical protein